MFTVDLDAVIQKLTEGHANYANRANPPPQTAGNTEVRTPISTISTISITPPAFSAETTNGISGQQHNQDATRTAPAIAPNEPGPHRAGAVTQEVETRRRRLLALLAERPEARYAVLTDTHAYPDAILLILAIRGRATCEFRIPRDRYAPFLLLDLIDRHYATVH